MMVQLRLTDDEEYLLSGFLEEIRRPQPIEGLTDQESKLVRALQAAPNRSLAPLFLADAVACNPSDPPETHVISVLVCKIKKKRPDLADRIETTWGQGYRWLA